MRLASRYRGSDSGLRRRISRGAWRCAESRLRSPDLIQLNGFIRVPEILSPAGGRAPRATRSKAAGCLRGQPETSLGLDLGNRRGVCACRSPARTSAKVPHQIRSPTASPASWLSISFSTGMVGGARAGVFPAVLESGLSWDAGVGRQGTSPGASVSAKTLRPEWSHDLWRHNHDQLGVRLVRCIDWKNFPRIGMSPRKGIFWKASCSVLSSRPPMTKLWPSASSISVFTFRVVIAGTSNPDISTASAKSSALTSGATCSRIVPRGLTVRYEIQANSILFEHDRDRSSGAAEPP